MNESSADPVARARKLQTTVLQGLTAVHASEIAASIGVSEACISRLKNEHLEHFSLMLAHLNLKLVPVSAQCYSQEYVACLKTLARAALRDDAPAPMQEWEQ